MNNFEEITKNPETLGAFLRGLPVIEAPWDEAFQRALNSIAGIESRVSRVEDGLFNNITGNPFLASFDSLDGITLVKGIWNEERKRIEC